jgi:hypothetical protein
MSRTGNSARSRLVALVLAGLALAPYMAVAQTPQPALSVNEIRACLCQEQKIAALRGVTADKDADYKDRTSQSKGLTAQINQMTATMNPTDTLAQDQLSELIDLRARVQNQIRDKALPALQQATNALNMEVQKYNSSCANRTIYDTDDVEAHKNLMCPKP